MIARHYCGRVSKLQTEIAAFVNYYGSRVYLCSGSGNPWLPEAWLNMTNKKPITKSRQQWGPPIGYCSKNDPSFYALQSSPTSFANMISTN